MAPKSLPPFDPKTSDGCTGVRDWARHCCVQHDKEYWEGTTDEDRARADENLRLCIQRAGKGPHWWLLSWVRWIGVRLLGRKAFFNKPHKKVY